MSQAVVVRRSMTLALAVAAGLWSDVYFEADDTVSDAPPRDWVFDGRYKFGY